jgi:DNA-binding NarL/FixJ family response regulator
MKNTNLIEIYVVDNDLLFLEEFKSNFTFEHEYKLSTFSSVQKFLTHLKEHNNKDFTFVIINDMIISHGLNTKSVVEILPMIKNIDKEISVVVLTDNDNRELKMSSSDLRPDAYVKNDKMLYFKIGPTINRIISRYELKKSKRNLQIAIIIAATIMTIAIIHFIIASIIG